MISRQTTTHVVDLPHPRMLCSHVPLGFWWCSLRTSQLQEEDAAYAEHIIFVPLVCKFMARNPPAPMPKFVRPTTGG